MNSRFVIINIIVLLINTYSIFSSLSFSYPSAVTLINGNYFVIHKYGISICYSSFSKIINNITIAENTAELISNENDLYKIEIKKFKDGYILCAIIDKIYIFNSYGIMKYKSNSLIPRDVKHLTLTPYIIKDNNYYYLFGYINQGTFYLYYYKFNQSQNIVISKIENFFDRVYLSDYEYRNYNIDNNGISCQFLYYNKYSKDVIACSYQITKYYNRQLTFSTFNINNYNNEIKFLDNKHYSWDKIENIKSSVTDDYSKELICLNTISGEADCIIYYLSDNYKLQYYYYRTKCSSKFYGFKVEYYQESEEFAFSCLAQNGGINVGFYDKSLTDAKYGISKFNDCSDINGYSLLYNHINNSYYIISDVKCNNIEYPFEEFIVEIDDKNDKLEGQKIEEDIDNEKE